MNTALCHNWTGFAVSIPGSAHIRRELPCQDASAAVTSPRPALIVCDGRGSASRSQEGAQAAVKAFQTQAAIFEPMLESILDSEAPGDEQWQMFARILYRTLMQVKLDLAAAQGVPEKEFDFTVACAVVGTQHIGCFQVGDGAIVLRQNGVTQMAFPMDKGEFANQTSFLRENGECRGKFHAQLFSAQENTGLAITSDGPEHLMFNLKEMTPGKIFGCMMDDLHEQSLCRQDLLDYLTRRDWEKDPRGGDDRSIAILVPCVYPAPAPAVPAEQQPQNETSAQEPTETTTNDAAIPETPASDNESSNETTEAPRQEPTETTMNVEITSETHSNDEAGNETPATNDHYEESSAPQPAETAAVNLKALALPTASALLLLCLCLCQVRAHHAQNLLRQENADLQKKLSACLNDQRHDDETERNVAPQKELLVGTDAPGKADEAKENANLQEEVLAGINGQTDSAESGKSPLLPKELQEHRECQQESPLHSPILQQGQPLDTEEVPKSADGPGTPAASDTLENPPEVPCQK